MALVEIRADLGRVADALERIVYLLERLVFPPSAADVKVQQATLDDLHIVTAEDHERMREEQAEFAERYRVVPGSEAFADALASWETEQRSLYGETWEAPQDWRAVFLQAQQSTGGSRSRRESPGTTG